MSCVLKSKSLNICIQIVCYQMDCNHFNSKLVKFYGLRSSLIFPTNKYFPLPLLYFDLAATVLTTSS